MIPERSPYYTYETKTIFACGERDLGTLAASETTGEPLKLAYRKYSKTAETCSNAIQLNLVFSHGNGMNKGVWHTHIDQLYVWLSELSTINSLVQLNTVIAIDVFNHGDSAELNEGRLGDNYDWRDSARDVIKVVTQDESPVFLNKDKTMNILVGHSLGGFIAMYTAYLGGPQLFDSCIAINPVAYSANSLEEGIERFRYWRDNFIKTEFTINDPENWYHEVETYFKKKSFHIRANDVVLKNMLEDDIPKTVRERKQNSHVALKSTLDAQMACYFNMHRSTTASYEKYKEIKIPFYRILGEKDTANEVARTAVADATKDVIHNIVVPGARHLLNSEDPLLTSQLLLLIIQQRVLLQNKKLSMPARTIRKASL